MRSTKGENGKNHFFVVHQEAIMTNSPPQLQIAKKFRKEMEKSRKKEAKVWKLYQVLQLSTFWPLSRLLSNLRIERERSPLRKRDQSCSARNNLRLQL